MEHSKSACWHASNVGGVASSFVCQMMILYYLNCSQIVTFVLQSLLPINIAFNGERAACDFESAYCLLQKQ